MNEGVGTKGVATAPPEYFRGLYQSLFEEVPTAIFVVDLESGKIVDANEAACRLLGHTRESLVGRLTAADLHPHDMAVFHQFAGEVSRSGSARTERLSCVTSSGRVVPVEIHASLFDGPDSRRMMRAIVLDTSRGHAVEQALRDEVLSRYDYESIVGRSEAWRDVLRQVELVARTDSPVLIHGETGTGKELIARAIHDAGRRRSRPLIALNCAAIPPGLAESELFGHEKGAFTGALALRRGRFECAHEGTLFLDEIGDLPPEMQPKLLRVLQEKAFERVGGTRSLRVDARLIAATHRDIAAMVAEGRFREDLFYRINVFPIQLPPLRSRREDVPLLATFFLSRSCGRMGCSRTEITRDALDRLVAYDWPGNVRELENVIERGIILSRGGTIEAHHVSVGQARTAEPPLADTTPADLSSSLSLRDAERGHILKALQAAAWRVSGRGGAADLLGLKPSTLTSRMKKLGIARPGT